MHLGNCTYNPGCCWLLYHSEPIKSSGVSLSPTITSCVPFLLPFSCFIESTMAVVAVVSVGVT